MRADQSDAKQTNNSAMDDDAGDVRRNSDVGDDPTLFCPLCSTRLLSLKCKLVCERCGYYMSCADYY